MGTIKRIEILLHENGNLESNTYGVSNDVEMSMILSTLAHRLYELKLTEKQLKPLLDSMNKRLVENISALKEMEILHEQ